MYSEQTDSGSLPAVGRYHSVMPAGCAFSSAGSLHNIPGETNKGFNQGVSLVSGDGLHKLR